MMASTKIWMPLYVGDYLADTTRLTTEQHGAYLLMLLDYWRNGPLPDDDGALAQITHLSPSAWASHKPALSKFFQITGCVWRSENLDAELKKAAENRAKASQKASAAAKARWERENAGIASGNAPSNAPGTASGTARGMRQALPEGMPEQCPSTSPSPTLNPSQGEDGYYGDRCTGDTCPFGDDLEPAPALDGEEDGQ